LPSNNVYGGNGWRVAVATIKAGKRTKTVRVVLKPVYISTTETTVSSGTPTPFFHGALGSAQGISGAGNLVTNSYTSTPAVPQPLVGFAATGADITTNGNSTFSGTDTIG